MTCKEKFLKEHPEFADNIDLYCPSDFNYMSDPAYCSRNQLDESSCEKCWNREPTCGDCKHYHNLFCEEPCCSCGPHFGNFKSKEEETMAKKVNESEQKEFVEGWARDMRYAYDALIKEGFDEDMCESIMMALVVATAK